MVKILVCIKFVFNMVTTDRYCILNYQLSLQQFSDRLSWKVNRIEYTLLAWFLEIIFFRFLLFEAKIVKCLNLSLSSKICPSHKLVFYTWHLIFPSCFADIFSTVWLWWLMPPTPSNNLIIDNVAEGLTWIEVSIYNTAQSHTLNSVQPLCMLGPSYQMLL